MKKMNRAMKVVATFEAAIKGTFAAQSGLFGLEETLDTFVVETYGKPFSEGAVKVVREGGTWNDYSMVPIVGWVVESVSVRDDPEGVMTVARACGFGQPAGIQNWDDYARFGYYEDGERTKPVLFLSKDTAGYRGIALDYLPTLTKLTVLDADHAGDFSHDVYELHPGEGGDAAVVVQSGSSGATVLAECVYDHTVKRYYWRISLISPILEGGEVYRGWYAETFQEAIER